MGSAWAQERREGKIRRPPDPDTVQTKSVSLKIIGKTPEFIRTENMDFVVIDSTQVVDIQGRQLSLEELPVPCLATIQYEAYSKSNSTYVWRIIYKGALQGATKAWSPPRPK
jgi:hypothetical protein